MPVRDALALLEQRHLAVRVPRKGVIVRPVTPRSVRAIFAARRLLETEITRLAVDVVGDEDLAAPDAIVERQRAAGAAGDLKAVRAADRDFHATIWRAGGNEVLEELGETVWRRALQARSVGHRTSGWSARSVARHERIVAALRRRDSQRAAAAAVDAVIAIGLGMTRGLWVIPSLDLVVAWQGASWSEDDKVNPGEPQTPHQTAARLLTEAAQ
jgi:DNA-binding GntR family transcriptional regulator